jgi:TetR/AcrR family transcriptional regulator, transcriptional repressor for nem operon
VPRTREYEADAVVGKAMRLFWRHGYGEASLPQLLAHTGLSRGSFYHAFRTKRGALVAALHHYMVGGMEGVLLPLMKPDAGRREIEDTFARMVDHTAGPGGHRGCLVNNCMTELGSQDAGVRDILTRARGAIERGFAKAVAKGQADGTIRCRESPHAMGRFFMNTFAGMNVAAKGRPERAALEDIARIALRTLDAGPGGSA